MHNIVCLWCVYVCMCVCFTCGCVDYAKVGYWNRKWPRVERRTLSHLATSRWSCRRPLLLLPMLPLLPPDNRLDLCAGNAACLLCAHTHTHTHVTQPHTDDGAVGSICVVIGMYRWMALAVTCLLARNVNVIATCVCRATSPSHEMIDWKLPCRECARCHRDESVYYMNWKVPALGGRTNNTNTMVYECHIRHLYMHKMLGHSVQFFKSYSCLSLLFEWENRNIASWLLIVSE